VKQPQLAVDPVPASLKAQPSAVRLTTGVYLLAARLAATVLGRFTLFQRFMVLSLMILIVGAYVIGSYVASEIKQGVIQRTSAFTALYVDSFVSPHVQELSHQNTISPVHFQHLDALLTNSSLGQKIVSFKVWNRDGEIVYASDRRLVGRIFPVETGLGRALAGEIYSNISNLRGEENLYERGRWGSLLETYAPVHADESGAIVGVSEFYQDPKELMAEVNSSQRKGWLIVGVSTAIMYLLLVGMVKGASNTISSQHRRLEGLATQNAALAERVRRAAARKSETDERLLMRIAQDLHDGPAQDVSLALLRLNSLREQTSSAAADPRGEASEDFELVGTALQSALKELRQISFGLRLPELEGLSLAGVVEKAVAEHQQKTGNHVHPALAADLPSADMPLKIAVYRVTQEALNNAYLHSGVDEQEVAVERGQVRLEVRDRGVGVGLEESSGHEERGKERSPLGLRGMRERVELLGGTLEVISEKGLGTTVRAIIPISEREG